MNLREVCYCSLKELASYVKPDCQIAGSVSFSVIGYAELTPNSRVKNSLPKQGSYVILKQTGKTTPYYYVYVEKDVQVSFGYICTFTYSAKTGLLLRARAKQDQRDGVVMRFVHVLNKQGKPRDTVFWNNELLYRIGRNIVLLERDGCKVDE